MCIVLVRIRTYFKQLKMSLMTCTALHGLATLIKLACMWSMKAKAMSTNDIDYTCH